jgi:hypothetical protein
VRVLIEEDKEVRPEGKNARAGEGCAHAAAA